MINNDFNDVVFNRTSVKVFDENVKISKQEMLEILNKAVRAPSSVNMQPWRFVIVESKEAKDKLRPFMGFNARQTDTSSAMILVFGDMKCYEKAEDIFSRTVNAGMMPKEVKEEMVPKFVSMYKGASAQAMNDIVKIDSSLMAMQLMLVARTYGYDTCPIGGFEADKITELFAQDKEHHVPVLIVAIGKANYTSHGSIRLDAQELSTFL